MPEWLIPLIPPPLSFLVSLQPAQPSGTIPFGAMMLFLTRIRDNFGHAFMPRLSEWSAASAVFGIGWILSLNEDLMQNKAVSVYDLMLMIGSQERWSICLMFFGFVRLVILLINGTIRRSPHLRMIAAFFSCFPLSLIALSFTPSLGIGTALAWVLVITDMINILRASGDARVADYLIAKDREPKVGSK